MHINSLHDVNKLARELHDVKTLIAYYNNHQGESQLYLSYDSTSSCIAIPITNQDSLLFSVLKQAKQSVEHRLEMLGVHA